MSKIFRGFTSVYSFTWGQSTRSKGFKLVTLLVTVGIIILTAILTILANKPEKTNVITAPSTSPITTVYILDDTDLGPTDYSTYIQEFSLIEYENINFIYDESLAKEDIINALYSNPTSLLVTISVQDNTYHFDVSLPDNTALTNTDVNTLLTIMTSIFTNDKLAKLGLNKLDLSSSLDKIIITDKNIDIHEDTQELNSTLNDVVSLLLPLLFGMYIYIILLFYGSSISKSISVEKTSKLVETLLISVHPYSLISGKILASTTVAVLQSMLWFLSIFVGFISGTLVSNQMFGTTSYSYESILYLLRESIGSSAFTVSSIVLAFLFLLCGFLFYTFMIGLFGSAITKPEDAASMQGLFMIPIVIGWLGSYLPLMSGNESAIRILRYIPLTAPFIVPVDLLLGTVGITSGIIMLIILILFTVAIILISGKLYKGLILYHGQKISFRLLIQLLKTQ